MVNFIKILNILTEKEEDSHGTFYNVVKRKKGDLKAMHVKQFTSEIQAKAYAKACNNKSTTHTFHVIKDKS